MNREKYKRFGRHFIGSDLHFNHKNILQYNKSSRAGGQDPLVLSEAEQWDLVDKMNESIIEKWNHKVRENDHVFLLGDLCMGQGNKMVDILRRLNGYKTLIKGNHDRTLMKLPEFQNDQSRLEIGFTSVHDYLCCTPFKGGDVVMSHFPMSNWDGESRGSVAFHGHCHGTRPDINNYETKRIMDVGIDTNDLELYDFEEVVARLQARPLPKFDHHGKVVS